MQEAASRPASLTRQLLAFSGKQTLELKVVDLNQLVLKMETMLRRLIGEDIDLQVALAPELAPISADISQIEQVVMNLVLNARDAMPRGGVLVLETAEGELDDECVRKHEGVNAGRHVMLTVSDTGCGMTAEVQDRIFEPFFTTKEPSTSTGLGLATVFGIVKQHNGEIRCYSEAGVGTAFSVYIPVATPAETECGCADGVQVETEKVREVLDEED